MLSRQRLTQMIVLLLALSLLLVACERPIPGSEDADTEATVDVSEDADSDAIAAEGDTQDTTEEEVTDVQEPVDEQEEAASEGDQDQTPRTEEEVGEAEEGGAEDQEAEEEAAADVEEETTEAAAEEEVEEETEETEEPAEEDVAEAEEETEEMAAEEEEEATPSTHTVAAGENLYRIGLRYNVSWVTLAELNGISNANDITVGQVLQIPTEPAAAEIEPTPSPLTETTYEVEPGDNLYRIGLKYGIAWTQIAEANGLVNPNQILVGQVLKIPVDTPGPTPQFTHQVKPDETLFLIALQYGVSWPTIAEANDLGSPYVIYPGQTLVIPGG